MRTGFGSAVIYKSRLCGCLMSNAPDRLRLPSVKNRVRCSLLRGPLASLRPQVSHLRFQVSPSVLRPQVSSLRSLSGICPLPSKHTPQPHDGPDYPATHCPATIPSLSHRASEPLRRIKRLRERGWPTGHQSLYFAFDPIFSSNQSLNCLCPKLII